MNIDRKLIIECNAKNFKKALKHVDNVKSQDTYNFTLTRTKFDLINKNTLSLTSTDGNRLTIRNIQVKSFINHFNEIDNKGYLLLGQFKEISNILKGVEKDDCLKIYQERKEKSIFYTFETSIKIKKNAFNENEREIKKISLKNECSNFPDIENIRPIDNFNFYVDFKAKETIKFLKDFKKHFNLYWYRTSYKDSDNQIYFYKVDNKYYFLSNVNSDKWIEKEIDFIEFKNLKEGEILSLNALYLVDALEDLEIANFKTQNYTNKVLICYSDKGEDWIMPMNINKNLNLPALDKKKESLKSKPASSKKKTPVCILNKSSFKIQETINNKKEILKKTWGIALKKLPKLYKKILCAVDCTNFHISKTINQKEL